MFELYFSLTCVLNIIYWFSVASIITNRNNIMLVLVAVEISFLTIILLFALSSSKTFGKTENQTYCLLLLVLAASESATGLALLINNYNYVSNTTFSNNQLLHG